MWNLDDIKVGDFIRVQTINKRGDRNLDGAIVQGTVKELVPSLAYAQLDSGWCVHTKDVLLEHRIREVVDPVCPECGKFHKPATCEKQ